MSYRTRSERKKDKVSKNYSTVENKTWHLVKMFFVFFIVLVVLSIFSTYWSIGGFEKKSAVVSAESSHNDTIISKWLTTITIPGTPERTIVITNDRYYLVGDTLDVYVSKSDPTRVLLNEYHTNMFASVVLFMFILAFAYYFFAKRM